MSRGERARAALLRGALVAAMVALTFAASIGATLGLDAVSVPFIVTVFVVVLPFATGACYCAIRWVGMEPLPFTMRLLGRASLPSRWQLVPGVAVAGGVGVFLLSIPVMVVAAPLFENATLDGHPFARLGGPELLAANLQVVAEEVVFRLLLLFPLAALFGVRAASRGSPGTAGWAAILVAGVLFGLAHAPDAGALGVDAAGYAVYAVVQKGLVGGVTFGYVAWRWGLEASILTHYAANLVAIGVSLLASSGAG